VGEGSKRISGQLVFKERGLLDAELTCGEVVYTYKLAVM